MWTIAWRTVKDKRVSLITYAVASAGLLVMYIALFPSIAKQAETFTSLLKVYPEALLKAFNFDLRSLTTLEGFLSTEQYSFVWPIMTVFLFTSFAGSSIAGGIDKGTMALVLSEPISRLKYFFAKYLTGVGILLGFLLVAIPAAIPLAYLFNLHPEAPRYWYLVLSGGLFGLAIFSIAMCASAFFSESGKVYFAVAGLVIAMYVLNIVSTLKDNLHFLQYYSFFHYYNPARTMTDGTIDPWSYAVFGGVIIITTALGAWWFTKRDIAV